MIVCKTVDEAMKIIERQHDEIIKAFENFLSESRLSKKTIKNHISNIDFFTEYLNHYASEPSEVKSVIDSDGGDIANFLGDWFPRKAMWGITKCSSFKYNIIQKVFFISDYKKLYKPRGFGRYTSYYKRRKKMVARSKYCAR